MPYKDPEVRKEKHTKYMRETWYPAHRSAHILAVKAAEASRKARTLAAVDKTCVLCGYSKGAIHFHHRDPSTKEFNIADAFKRYSVARILAEIAKCDILCANCHGELDHGTLPRRAGKTVIR